MHGWEIVALMTYQQRQLFTLCYGLFDLIEQKKMYLIVSYGLKSFILWCFTSSVYALLYCFSRCHSWSFIHQESKPGNKISSSKQVIFTSLAWKSHLLQQKSWWPTTKLTKHNTLTKDVAGLANRCVKLSARFFLCRLNGLMKAAFQRNSRNTQCENWNAQAL